LLQQYTNKCKTGLRPANADRSVIQTHHCTSELQNK